jgi:hypothetical protein
LCWRPGTFIHKTCIQLNLQIAPSLGTKEKAVLFAGMCYLEGHYHRETQIRFQMTLLFTGLVLFRGVLQVSL